MKELDQKEFTNKLFECKDELKKRLGSKMITQKSKVKQPRQARTYALSPPLAFFLFPLLVSFFWRN